MLFGSYHKGHESQCDFVSVLVIKQTLMSTFFTLLHELLHLFVSSTTANLRASTEDINENKSSTQGSMPDSSNSHHEQYQSVLHPHKASVLSVNQLGILFCLRV